MNRPRTGFCIAILLAGLMDATAAWTGDGSRVTRAEDLRNDPIRLQRLATHIQFLGGDSLRGRAPGTEGGARAAAYIAEQLRMTGVAPAGVDGSYNQQVPMYGSRVAPGTRLTLVVDGMEEELAYGRDYLLYAGGDATYIAKPASLVFVGYGISAPEYDYNDYQDVDVSDAVVVFLPGEPWSKDPGYFDGPRPTWHATAEAKRSAALAHGARGTIQLPELPADPLSRGRSERIPTDGSQHHSRPDGPKERDATDAPLSRSEVMRRMWERRREFGVEYRSLPYAPAQQFAALLSPDAAADLFRAAPYTYESVCAMDSTGQVRSFALHARLSFHGRFREREFHAPNVVGRVTGADPLLRDSFLIVSAHYDGLGVGPPVEDDSIYNGVIDNASGVAAVLEIAREMAEHPPARSVLFLFVTGEETGLLGSRYYCDHPLVPIDSTIAALNVDGLAFLDTFRDVVGIGAEYSTLGDLLGAVAARRGLRVSPIPEIYQIREEFPRSDQYAFAQAGIPSVLVQEGLQLDHFTFEEGALRIIDWATRVYHSPWDDLAQPIRIEAVMEHQGLLSAFADTLANVREKPRWSVGSPFAAARLRSRARSR